MARAKRLAAVLEMGVSSLNAFTSTIHQVPLSSLELAQEEILNKVCNKLAEEYPERRFYELDDFENVADCVL